MNRIAVSLTLILMFVLPVSASAFPAIVLEIVDGDTVVVAPNGDKTAPVSVRLAGIDAPEMAQPYGKRAREWVATRIPVGTQVEIVSYSGDKYRRAIGLVQVDGQAINGEMVRQGMAWVYEGYISGKMKSLWKRWERQAKKARRGLWAGKDIVEPWKWRKSQKVQKKSIPNHKK